jgi:hypothetical protein
MPLLGTRGAGSVKGFGFTEGVKPVQVDYLVVAGGGAGGFNMGGGGGAGGYITSFPGGTKIVLPIATYPIIIGAGGTGSNTNPVSATKGTASIFSTITAAGGGIGIGQCSGYSPFPNTDRDGGSGGGSGGQLGCYSGCAPGGIGNSPPVSPPQGNDGGRANLNNTPGPNPAGGKGGGGGGASTAGADSFAVSPSSGSPAGPGGNGATNLISDSSVIYAGGGGGGGTQYGGNQCGGTGGPGGGGPGGAISVGGTAGTTNTGGGGGASGGSGGFSGSGGSGIVIIRAPGSASLSASPGTNTVTTLPAPAGGCKVATFTVSGDLTVS